MKDEVLEYFKGHGFTLSKLKKSGRGLKPGHIKAGMTNIFRERKKYRPDQLGRAALRDAESIQDREEYEDELKLNRAVKELVEKDQELVVERERYADLKRKLLIWYLLLAYFVSIGFVFIYPYLGQIWEKIK